MRISPRVQQKLDNEEAIVAIESTILTHGLSYPRSLQLMLEIEDVIREHQAEPAVVAMINGELCIGLEREELEWLAQVSGKVKLTTADLGVATVKKQSGGTTAATTVWLANKVGIKIALAGGLGGVHRDVHETWDISGDLTAMAQSPVMLVCGGVKTFLDVGKSLEALETLGVPTWSYQNNYFPGYFVHSSSYKAENIASAVEGASMARAHWELGLKTGIVIGVSIPEKLAFESEELENIIEQAISNNEASTGGKGVTPYIIRKLEEHTKGRSGEVNRALLISASEVAAKLAVAYSKQK